ncbi:MAG TPA: response regulator transcription factor [Burkholderiales bacterium]|jgi:two-component system, NarL family, invasion response regulator UvrY|nr:response regulator transcription factor [Burkholderiales bacterium]
MARRDDRNAIRVLIADDHAILRRGLRQIIEETDDICVVGEAESSAETLQQMRTQPCEVVLLDISMPDRNGMDTLQIIRKDHSKVAVLMLSTHPENQYAVRALREGAAGYLTKQSAPAQLVNAIRQVSTGKKYVTPAVAEELAKHVLNDSDRPPHELLSNREYQTMCLIAGGRTVTEIGLQLSLSAKTVSVYRARVLAKLGLTSNAAIAHYAIKNKLVE